jgi:hypothetical protein
MKLAFLFVACLVSTAAAQDDWRPLRIERVESLPDGAITTEFALTPSPGALEIVVAPERSCQSKPTATYHVRGAVVMIRIDGPTPERPCTPTHAPVALSARVAGLKPKRYQVVVQVADAKGHWRPWKAGVVAVP